MMPKPSGQCRLLDGTVILASGEHDVMGDAIQKTITIAGQAITFDAIGVAAVRLDRKGEVAALAAGGMRHFGSPNLKIWLGQPIDLAVWRGAQDEWRGVVQGWNGPLPEALSGLTTNWIRLRVPEPMNPDAR